MDVTGDNAARVSPHLRRWAALLAFAGAVAAIDQAAKEAIRSTFAPGEGFETIGQYEILHVQNSGVAGGGLEGNALPLAVLAMLVVMGLYEFLRQRRDTLLLVVGFGLLLGGGVGNLVDRARLGSVTDYIRDGDRAFNLADLAIFAGGLVVFAVLLSALWDLGNGRRHPTSSGA